MVSETEKEEVESDAEKEEVESDAEPLIDETKASSSIGKLVTGPLLKETQAAAASTAEGKGRGKGGGRGRGKAVVKPNAKISRKRQIDDLVLSEEEKAQRKVEEEKLEVEVEALARLLTEI